MKINDMDLNILDDKFENEEVFVDEPYMPVIYKYGGIGAAIIVVISTLTNYFATDATDMGFTFVISMFLSFLSIVSYVFVMTFAVLNYKKMSGGFVSFGRAFVISYLTGLMMAVIGLIFSLTWIYFFGLPQASMEGLEEMSKMFENENTTFMVMAAASFFSMLIGCAIGAVIALIVSAATKNERPINFNVS